MTGEGEGTPSRVGATPLPLQVRARLREAFLRYRREAYAEAESLARNLLSEVGPLPPVVEVLGLTLAAQKRAQEIESLLLDTLGHGGESPGLLFALATAAADRGSWPEALDRYRRLFERYPNFSGGRLDYALALEQNKKSEEALGIYESILETERSPDAALHYALLLEEYNRLEEAERWLRVALAERPGDVLGRILAAQLAYRHGRHQEALERLEELYREDLSLRNAAVVAGRRVRVLDALGRYDEAARAADEGHAKLRALVGEARDSLDPYDLQAVEIVFRRRALALTSDPGRFLPAVSTPSAFLVGFPRSGTTLLDRMLAVHPEVRVLEEENPFAPLFRYLIRVLAGSASGDLDAEEIRSLVANLVRSYASGDRTPRRVVLDKLPLNSLYAGWLARFAPESRFVVAVRDPRDVVLSCWLQAFAPNAAMRQFWELGSAVDYYVRVMELLRFWLEASPLRDRCFLVRYEDLVRDPAAILRPLSSFLGIEYRPEMTDPARSTRGVRLGTPSYDQVMLPVTDAAVGRWRHYSRWLGPHLARLEPWVRYWGYPSSVEDTNAR